MEPFLFVPLLLLGGLAALDTTSVGQLMLSRPIVSGTLAGAVLGDPVTGLFIGGFIECFLLPVVPVGGGRFPEGGPAAVVAAVVATRAGGGGAWALGLAAGLAWAVLGGVTIELLRHLNARLAPDPGDPRLTRARIVRAQLGAIGLDLLRGLLLTATGILLWLPLAGTLAGSWPLGPDTTVALAALAGSVPLGYLLSTMGGRGRRLAYLVVGVALGLGPLMVW